MKAMAAGRLWNAVKILFVCVGNSCRSQMAEAYVHHLGQGEVSAWSAGSHPLGSILPETVEAMREKGIALDGQWSKGLRDVPLSEMDIIVSMGRDVICPVPPEFRGQRVEWNIPDPYGVELNRFHEVRDLIEKQVRALLAYLKQAKTTRPEGRALSHRTVRGRHLEGETKE